MKIARRITDIPMSGIMKVFDLTSPGSTNLDLEEPNLDPPREAVKGMNTTASAGRNKYGPTTGIPEPRDTIADYYSQYGRLESGNVIVTPSVFTALLEIAQSMVDSGDEVLIPSPGFVIYGLHVKPVGVKVV